MPIFQFRKNPKREKAWREIAHLYGGEYIQGGHSFSEKVRFVKDGLLIILDTGKLDIDKHGFGQEYTRVIAPYQNRTGFHCEMYQERFFHGSEKKLGLQDIEVGINSFDKMFILKSNKPLILKKLFRNHLLIREMKKHPRMHFMVKTKNRFLGGFHPAGTDELSFAENGLITDISRLKSVFEMFTLVHKQMLEIGLAHK